ncbi:MAG TPA: hypothetical protein PKH24_14285 [Sedimentisphaerales bacterium]|jgi:hypothetical protein|nr:hypothetical protein [Sedimentisphaerales bacterium]HNU29784.1 hypothetical protein [Sedimentisphaerales bacterium]
MKTLLTSLVIAQAVGWALPTGSAADRKQTVIVVVGAAGAPEYAPEFARWAGLWQQACARGDAGSIGIGLEDEGEYQDCERIRTTLAAQSQETATPLWLVLIGHGTYDGKTARFNLRGPDLAASDLAEWLKPIERPLAIIDTASASAPFLKELSAPGRVVVTATKSGFEYNYARFGQYLAEAIAQPQADLDKDGQTSLLEAWLTASHSVAAFYTANGRLATEHALLDDNGDGLGTPAEWFRGIRPAQKARNDTTLDGYRAHQFHLVPSATELAMPSELRARRDQLELQILELRDAKAQFPETEYYGKLEALLRGIASVYEQAEASSVTR